MPQVELPEYFSTPERHLSLIALGWGRTSPGSDFSSVLNVAPNLNRLSPGECFRRHGGRVLSLLCAGGAGVGTCKGREKVLPIIFRCIQVIVRLSSNLYDPVSGKVSLTSFIICCG